MGGGVGVRATCGIDGLEYEESRPERHKGQRPQPRGLAPKLTIEADQRPDATGSPGVEPFSGAAPRSVVGNREWGGVSWQLADAEPNHKTEIVSPVHGFGVSMGTLKIPERARG
jgi:hypothetical protein